MEYLTATGTIVAIATSIITTIIATLQFFKFKKKEKETEKTLQNIASTGAALGYYYNLLAQIFSILKEKQLELEIYEDNSISKNIKFDSENVEFLIIMPESLNASGMQDAMNTMKAYPKGDILRKGNDRNLGINYSIDGNRLVIIDFPTAFGVIRQHMMLDKKIVGILDNRGMISSPNALNSDVWKQAEKEEIQNFKATILHLIERGQTETGKGKIEFVSVKDFPVTPNA